MIPRYPYVVIIHYKAETRKPVVTKQFETLATAMAMRNENIGRKYVHKIVVGIELDVTENP